MTSKKLQEPHYITQDHELQQLVKELLQEPIIAVDTESNSLYAYQEQVCLIQFSTSESDYLVDPLTLEDLSPLSSVFDDPRIEKVFHAAEYDLLCLKRDFKFKFSNLFDTMIAARILGRKAVGLGALLKVEYGVNLDKRFQRSNWGQRPLSKDMQHYAHLDTHYLIPLRNLLSTDLKRKQLLALAMEDFNRLSSMENGGIENQTGKHKLLDCWRIRGAYDLDPQQAAVLFELCRYRDQKARELDRPLFKVISNMTLFAIAERMPKKLDELRQIPGMNSRQIKWHGDSLLKAIRRGKHSEPLYPPRNQRLDDNFLSRLDTLRRWRKQVGLNMGVPSDVILPRDLMLALANENPKSPDELERILHDVPWRLDHFGDQIYDVITSRE